MKINRRAVLTGIATAAVLPCLAAEARAEGLGKSEMPGGGVILTAVVKANPGEEETVREILLGLVDLTRKEPGCLCYNLHQSKSDNAQFMFYEQWATQEAFDAHGKMPYMKALGGKLKGHTEKGVLTFYQLLK